MSTAAATSPALAPVLARDLIALMKPSITGLCVFMAAGGFALALRYAPGAALSWTVLWALLGTTLSVGSANALNMWLERDVDGLMTRTRSRPLPAGRMAPWIAIAFGLVLGTASVTLLWLMVNPLTAVIGAAAIVSYVWIYTPLKRRTPMALLIGAFPGAVPPLMGWTAATGTADPAAWALFAIMVVWQIPHFLAIALYRRQEYAKAGIRTVANVRGDRAARVQSVAWSVVLVPATLAPAAFGVAGLVYLVAAGALSVWFLAVSIRSLTPNEGDEGGTKAARGLFLASLVYLPAVTVAFVADAFAGIGL